jgi:hypothetical protein
MSRTTTLVDPANVTSPRVAPDGTCDAHERTTGFGVDGPAATGLGDAAGLGEVAGVGETSGLGEM